MPLVLDGTTGFNLPSGAEIGVGTTAPAGNGLHVDHTAGATLRLTRLGTSTSHFVQLETDGAHGKLQSGGNFEIDVASNIILDSDSGTVQLKDNGTEYVQFFKNGNNVQMTNTISDGDIIFRGNDGGSMTNALTLDMSNLGFASFNANAFFNESASDVDFRIKGTSVTNMFYADASTNRVILGYNSGRVPVNVLVPHVNSSITPAMRISTYGVGGYSSSNSQGAGARLEFGQYDDGYDWVTGSISSIRTGGNWGGDLTFYTNNNSASNNQTERMRIELNGNIGIGTTNPTANAYDIGSRKLSVASTTLNNASSGYLELSARANTNGYNAGAIQFNNAENANTTGTGTQNRTVGQIRTVITTTDSNAGDDSGGTMQFWTKPEAQALANTMRISTDDPNHRADVTVDATQLAGDGGANANAFFNAKAKGYYYAGLDIKSNDGHVGGWIGHWNGSSTARNLQARVGGNGINASDYQAIYVDYLGRVTHPSRPHFRVRGFPSHFYVSTIQSAEDGRLRNWNSVDVNRGSHFANSTGKFTIPVTGDYAFYCTVMYTNPSTMDFHLTFKLNGSTLTASNDHNGGGGGQGHQWNGTTLCYSGYFNANDYVGYSITGGGTTSTTYLYQSNTYNVMGGYLL